MHFFYDFMSIYIVDSNILIEAYKRNYHLDVVHSFWKKLTELANDGKIISIDRVRSEIYDNREDELKSWCVDNLPVSFFKDSKEVIREYTSMVAWAQSKSAHFKHSAIADFSELGRADAWLISYALANPQERVLVTQEVSDPRNKTVIKIPDACKENKIRCINTMQMFKELKETF